MDFELNEVLASFFSTSFVSGVLYGVPAMMFLRRANMNENIAFLAVVPVGAVVLLWVLAFRSQQRPEVRSGR